MSHFSDLIQFIKKHRTFSILTICIAGVVLTIIVTFLQNQVYLTNIVDITDTQISSFVNSPPNSTIHIPDIGSQSQYVPDKFIQAYGSLSFSHGFKDNLQFDYAFTNDAGRYRIMCFESPDSGTSSDEFMYFTLSPLSAKFKSPWFGIVRSKYAEFYWNDDFTGPFIQTWYYENSFIILLSETDNSGRQIRQDLKNYAEEASLL